MPFNKTRRKKMPDSGADWPTLQASMRALASDDIKWRNAKTAVYVFNPGDDVMDVVKEAYAMFQSENGLGSASAFPSLKRMEDDVVNMGLELLNAPEGACGNMTSGGSESIFLALKTCREQARAEGKNTRDAEIVMPRSGHPAFDKAAHYLDLKTVRVPVNGDWLADVEAMRAAISERTIMLLGSAPCFPYGLIDPLAALSDLALEHGIWLHTDACVGGYFAPFARMNGVDLPVFDFSLPGVRSISADLHKYGYAAKGASTIFHRTEAQRELQKFSCGDWPCGVMTTPSMAGTRPGGAIAAAWAVMHYLGVSGYRDKVRQVIETREYLAAGIEAIDGLRVVGAPQLGLIAYGSERYNMGDIWAQMRTRGWFSPVLDDPPAIHLMLSPAHAGVRDNYLNDLAEVCRQTGASEAPPGATKAQYN